MRSNIALSALVCAGIIAWLSGFVSRQLVDPAEIKTDAVKIEVAETALPVLMKQKRQVLNRFWPC